ncbi:ATP-binding protein [Kitasatospora paranensis]|uniref:ATP-binding protein n=2 Tax=Kitasatospora paranensis TaxID=258053 RepID=A0ABW2G871_9ACTN
MLPPPMTSPDTRLPGFSFDIRPAANPGSVGTVRRLLRDALVAVGSDPATPCLLLSELLTNALLHGRAASVALELRQGRLLMAVTDRSPAPVEVPPESATRTTGRGMTLVEALADAWGVVPLGASGKTVWAVVAA